MVGATSVQKLGVVAAVNQRRRSGPGRTPGQAPRALEVAGVPRLGRAEEVGSPQTWEEVSRCQRAECLFAFAFSEY